MKVSLPIFMFQKTLIGLVFLFLAFIGTFLVLSQPAFADDGSVAHGDCIYNISCTRTGLQSTGVTVKISNATNNYAVGSPYKDGISASKAIQLAENNTKVDTGDTNITWYVSDSYLYNMDRWNVNGNIVDKFPVEPAGLGTNATKGGCWSSSLDCFGPDSNNRTFYCPPIDNVSAVALVWVTLTAKIENKASESDPSHPTYSYAEWGNAAFYCTYPSGADKPVYTHNTLGNLYTGLESLNYYVGTDYTKAVAVGGSSIGSASGYLWGNTSKLDSGDVAGTLSSLSYADKTINTDTSNLNAYVDAITTTPGTKPGTVVISIGGPAGPVASFGQLDTTPTLVPANKVTTSIPDASSHVFSLIGKNDTENDVNKSETQKYYNWIGGQTSRMDPVLWAAMLTDNVTVGELTTFNDPNKNPIYGYYQHLVTYYYYSCTSTSLPAWLSQLGYDTLSYSCNGAGGENDATPIVRQSTTPYTYDCYEGVHSGLSNFAPMSPSSCTQLISPFQCQTNGNFYIANNVNYTEPATVFTRDGTHETVKVPQNPSLTYSNTVTNGSVTGNYSDSKKPTLPVLPSGTPAGTTTLPPIATIAAVSDATWHQTILLGSAASPGLNGIQTSWTNDKQTAYTGNDEWIGFNTESTQGSYAYALYRIGFNANFASYRQDDSVTGKVLYYAPDSWDCSKQVPQMEDDAYVVPSYLAVSNPDWNWKVSNRIQVSSGNVGTPSGNGGTGGTYKNPPTVTPDPNGNGTHTCDWSHLNLCNTEEYCSMLPDSAICNPPVNCNTQTACPISGQPAEITPPKVSSIPTGVSPLPVRNSNDMNNVDYNIIGWYYGLGSLQDGDAIRQGWTQDEVDTVNIDPIQCAFGYTSTVISGNPVDSSSTTTSGTPLQGLHYACNGGYLRYYGPISNPSDCPTLQYVVSKTPGFEGNKYCTINDSEYLNVGTYYNDKLPSTGATEIRYGRAGKTQDGQDKAGKWIYATGTPYVPPTPTPVPTPSDDPTNH